MPYGIIAIMRFIGSFLLFLLGLLLCMLATASNDTNKPKYSTLATKYRDIRITSDASYQIEGVLNNVAEVGSPIILKASGIESQYTTVYFLPFSKYEAALQSRDNMTNLIYDSDYTYTIRVVKFMANYELFGETGFNNVELQEIFEPTLELLFVPDIESGKYILVTRHYDFVDIAETDALEWYSPSINSLKDGDKNLSRYIVDIIESRQHTDYSISNSDNNVLLKNSTIGTEKNEANLNAIWSILLVIVGSLLFLCGYALRGAGKQSDKTRNIES